MPALQSSRSQLTEDLKEARKGASGSIRSRRSLNALVVIEIALAIVLVAGAGLMMRSFRSVLGIDPGFNPHNVLTFSSALPLATYKDQQQQLQFFERALAKVQALPGVQSAAGVFRVPIAGFATAIFSVQGKPVPAGQAPFADYRPITVDYFRAMGIRLVKGREFTERDSAAAPDAVIVNEELARRFWPGEDPIGKRLQIATESTRWREVVGVVGNARLSGLEAKVDPAIYVPFPQNSWPNALRNSFIVLRATVDPQGLIPVLRRELRSVDPSFPIAQVRTMDEIVGDSLSQRQFNTALLALFAFVAVALAAVGIYGVMSYTVSQRTREMGIRMALGAGQSDITKLVTLSGARLAALGITIGIVAAGISNRLIAGLLFGVTAIDPITFVLTAVLLGAVTLLASYVPSRRAAGTDPFLRCATIDCDDLAKVRGLSVRYVGNQHASEGAVQELGRVAEFGLVLLERVSFHGVFSAQTHVHVANHGGEELLIDIAVTQEVAAGNHTAMGRHDAGVGTDESGEFFVGADTAAEPGAIAVIQKRPLLAGHRPAGDQHVQLWKMYIEIAVGVCRGQVAVVDLMPVKLQRAIAAESSSFGRAASGSGARRPLKRHGRDGVAQVHSRFFVSEDDAAVAAHSLVGAGLFRMPVRVDQRM